MRVILRKIYELIKNTLKYHTLNRLPLDILEGKHKYTNMQALREDLLGVTDEKDMEFMKSLTSNQLF